jgi:hypothetical protein
VDHLSTGSSAKRALASKVGIGELSNNGISACHSRPAIVPSPDGYMIFS